MEKQRLGRKTIQYCPTCGVVLCKFCWEKFHSNDIELPACSPFLHMLSTPTTTRCPEVEQETEMMFIRRRQVSPRIEGEVDDEEEMIEEEAERVETASEAETSGRRTARTGKTYSPRKKGRKQKRGASRMKMKRVRRAIRVMKMKPQCSKCFEWHGIEAAHQIAARVCLVHLTIRLHDEGAKNHGRNSHQCVDCEAQWEVQWVVQWEDSSNSAPASR